MSVSWDPVTLGRSGFRSSAIGLGSSYGISGRDVERAFERGINYFYWGSRRTAGFAEAIRALAPQHRQDMIVVVQTYTRLASLMRPSLDRALRRLGIEYVDFLLLGWWNRPPPAQILDAALALREAGKVRHIMVSSHHRPTFAQLIRDKNYGALMVRYNAAHRGAETEVFPYLEKNPPGIVTYTTTRWGSLLNPILLPSGEPVPRASDCYRFALSNRSVNMCLAGPKDGSQLDEALAALDRGPMDEDELAWMRRLGDSVHKKAFIGNWPSLRTFLGRGLQAIRRALGGTKRKD